MGEQWERSPGAQHANATGSAKNADGVMKALFCRSARDLWTYPASYLPTNNNGTLEDKLPSLASEVLRIPLRTSGI